MKIVILGYTGLIGQRILEDLVKNSSFDLICVGRERKKYFYKRGRVKYFTWDFSSFDKLSLSFLKKANIIINCVGKTKDNNDNLKDINFILIKNLLKYIITHRLKCRLIHLSSVAVYGSAKNYFNKLKIIKENSPIKINNLYSKSKYRADKLIINTADKYFNKNFSFTILRISNVFGKKKNSNLYNFVMFSIKHGFWINTSKDIMYNFINVKDVSQVVKLIISNLKISKNKTYIVSDDFKQSKLYDFSREFYGKKIINISFPISFIKILIYFLPMPATLLNFFLTISSKINYSNKKIRKDLNFKPKFSLLKKL